MKSLVVLSALIALPLLANAEEKVQGSGPNPYTECGIGAAIFQDTAWAAATSNVIFDLGTTAITSAQSSPESCNAKKAKTAKLIIDTMEGLEADIAAGGGAYTTALVDTMGCSATASAPAFAANLRGEYANVAGQPGYATQTREERAVGMYRSVKSAAAKTDASCATSL